MTERGHLNPPENQGKQWEGVEVIGFCYRRGWITQVAWVCPAQRPTVAPPYVMEAECRSY